MRHFLPKEEVGENFCLRNNSETIFTIGMSGREAMQYEQVRENGTAMTSMAISPLQSVAPYTTRLTMLYRI